MMSNSNITLLIKLIREFRNFSQSYMAYKLGIKQNTYSLIESGKILIKPKRLQEISVILNVSVEFLMKGDADLLTLHIDKNIKNSENEYIELIDTMNDEIFCLREQNKILLTLIRKYSINGNGA